MPSMPHFGAAHAEELRKIAVHNMPQNIVCYGFVIMTQHIADPRDLAPWHIRVPLLQRAVKVAAGFGNNFETTLHNPALAAVEFERL
jgi:hypothetical protein